MPEKDYDIILDDLPEDCRQIAELIGLDGLLALSRKFAGDQLRIPRPEKLAVPARNRAIRAEFNGRNYRELAIKYGVTVRWVRAIVSGQVADKSACDPEPQDAYKQVKLF